MKKLRRAKRIVNRPSVELTDHEKATLTIFAEIIADIIITKMDEEEFSTIERVKKGVQKFPLNNLKRGRIVKI